MNNPNCCFVHFLSVNLFMSFPLNNFLEGGLKKKKKREEKKNLFSSKICLVSRKTETDFFFG